MTCVRGHDSSPTKRLYSDAMIWSGNGHMLIQYAFDAAISSGSDRVYMCSTGAKAYSSRWHLYDVLVSEVVATLPDTPQV